LLLQEAKRLALPNFEEAKRGRFAYRLNNRVIVQVEGKRVG
jgi:hypothetical protein